MASSAKRTKVVVATQPPRISKLAARRADGTLTDIIQVALRDEILNGDYRPGEKLSITTIAREKNVSLSVTREALTRLTADGLVTSEAMQGFSVVETSIADLLEVGDLLGLLMGTAIRKSIEHGGAEWEAALIAAHHIYKRAVMAAAAAGGRPTEVDNAHGAFWETLTSACGSVRLIALLQSLYRSMRLYHRLAIILLKDEAMAVVARYWAVTEAAIAGDADTAVRLMQDDIDRAVAACRTYLLTRG